MLEHALEHSRPQYAQECRCCRGAQPCSLSAWRTAVLKLHNSARVGVTHHSAQEEHAHERAHASAAHRIVGFSTSAETRHKGIIMHCAIHHATHSVFELRVPCVSLILHGAFFMFNAWLVGAVVGVGRAVRDNSCPARLVGICASVAPREWVLMNALCTF